MGGGFSAEERNRLVDENTRKTESIANLERQVDGLREANTRKTEEIEELESQIDSLREANTRKTEETEELERQIDIIKRDLDTAQEQLTKKKEEIATLKNKVIEEQKLKEDERKNAGKLQRELDNVLLNAPWRKMDSDMWTRQNKNALLEKIHVATTPILQKNIRINIMLFGVCNSGKSSFINTCATALRDDGRLIKLATVGSSSESITTRLRDYKITSKDHSQLISMYDCRGLDDTRGVQTKDLISIVKGHIQSNYEINPEEPISENNELYTTVPDLKDKMHCVLFVINAEIPNESILSNYCHQQFKEVATVLEAEEIPVFVILCKIDTLHISEENRLHDLFSSRAVEKKCRAVSEKLQIPLTNVLPMSNYYEESQPTLEKDVLALTYIKSITECAVDRLRQVYCIF